MHAISFVLKPSLFLSLSTHQLSQRNNDDCGQQNETETLGHFSQSWGPQAHLSQQHRQHGHRTGGHRSHLSIISCKKPINREPCCVKMQVFSEAEYNLWVLTHTLFTVTCWGAGWLLFSIRFPQTFKSEWFLDWIQIVNFSQGGLISRKQHGPLSRSKYLSRENSPKTLKSKNCTG